MLSTCVLHVSYAAPQDSVVAPWYTLTHSIAHIPPILAHADIPITVVLRLDSLVTVQMPVRLSMTF